MYIFLYTKHFFYFFLREIQNVKFTECDGVVVILNLISSKVFQVSSSNISCPSKTSLPILMIYGILRTVILNVY